MAEGLIMPLAESILRKVASYTGDLLVDEIKAAMSVKKDLKIMAEKLEAICAVLADAEKKQYASNAIKIWLRDLKSFVYDFGDLLDEIATDALQRRVNEGHLGRQLWYYLSFSNPLISRFVMSHKINILRVKLENIMAKKNDFNLTKRPVEISEDGVRNPSDRSPYIHEPSIIGREAAKCDILSQVSAISDAHKELSVLPIVGMAGIGKTALAKLVSNNVLGFDLKLWACVSDKFQLQTIIKDIVKDGTGGENLSSQDLNTLIKRLHSLLKGKKYFLVLDDVWEDNIARWLELKNLLAVGKAGSIILITTRSIHVAWITGTVEPYNLGSLPAEACWSIFKQLAFAEGEEKKYRNFVTVGQLIVEKCNGVPLIVKTLGSLLRKKYNIQEWESIKNMDSFVGLREPDETDVKSILKLSYNKLPSHLKLCFSYLSLFLKGAPLFSAHVIYRWSALGLLQLRYGETEIESTGFSYFKGLISRSLLQEPDITLNNVYHSECKMHDLMHDLASDILEEELFIVTQDNMRVPPHTRHLIWRYDDSNSLKELANAPNIRSFKFGYKTTQVSRSFLEGIISKFNCLRILDLSECQFEELPKTVGNLKHLRFLDLTYNWGIKSLPNSICNLLNLEAFNLYGCGQLKNLPDDIYLLQSLRMFVVTTCEVSLGTKFNELSSLRCLEFRYCQRLMSLWDDNYVGSLTSLQYLSITDCPNLTSLPRSMKFLAGLETLYITNCEMLNLEEVESLHGLQRLRQLYVEGVPRLVSLPQGLQSAAASLQDLFIYNCRGLVELPDWLQCFTSLSRITIAMCPNIISVPQGFCHLNSVQQLIIFRCPQLSERVVPNGVDHFLVRHIAEVILDGFVYTPTEPSTPLVQDLGEANNDFRSKSIDEAQGDYEPTKVTVLSSLYEVGECSSSGGDVTELHGNEDAKVTMQGDELCEEEQCVGKLIGPPAG